VNEQRHQRPRVNWEVVKFFENQSFLVEISKLPLRYPKFSISISGRNRGGNPGRFIPVTGSASNGVFTVRPILADLRELIDSAENYIQRELQRSEDQRIDDAEARARKNESRGPQQRPGLKELSKRDRQRRQREREQEKDSNE
jgi:hypothetical protein